MKTSEMGSTGLLAAVLAGALQSLLSASPFPAALEAVKVSVASLDDGQGESLIVGND